MASLSDADLTLKLGKSEGARRLTELQDRLLTLRLQAGGQLGDHTLGPPLCVLFEGWDAAGKGGAIRRLVAPLDPRHVRTAQYAAPSADEKRHHFLLRFTSALPGWGGMAVLDRSWYGRLVVERVEKFATKSEWKRAYEEIVDFEKSLHAEGMVLVKCWLHVSEDEQRKRFEARAENPLKAWKLTDEDWRNLDHRDKTEKAVVEMLKRTDHPAAPWTVISAESKPYARVQVLETVIAALEQGLLDHGQEPIGSPTGR